MNSKAFIINKLNELINLIPELHIRAYISTLTSLSGYSPINIPTLNLNEFGRRPT